LEEDGTLFFVLGGEQRSVAPMPGVPPSPGELRDVMANAKVVTLWS